jgi:hypothetical protein
MVKFEEDAYTKNDTYFVKEDPARIYRGLRDLLVEEFDIDRITESKSEFTVSQPRDKIKLHAFKEKSPHTVIHYDLQYRTKRPKKIFKMERDQDILKARVLTKADIITRYPGREDISWFPVPEREQPTRNVSKSGLRAEEESRFHNSKFYKILVGIWYNKFYSKEIHMYEEEAKETILHLHDLMREKFGAEKTIGRTDASHFKPTWK